VITLHEIYDKNLNKTQFVRLQLRDQLTITWLLQLSTHFDLLYRFTEKHDNSNTFLADRILTDDEWYWFWW